MDQQALLDSLRGSINKRQFANRLGITHRALNYIEAGRKPGRRVIQRLIQAYPERSAEIVQTFLTGAS
jgi:transcriptional regulator with XRE-family HTH domain